MTLKSRKILFHIKMSASGITICRKNYRQQKGKRTHQCFLAKIETTGASILKQNTWQTDCLDKFKLTTKRTVCSIIRLTCHMLGQHNAINVTGLQRWQPRARLQHVTRATFRNNNTNFGMICSYPLNQTSAHNLNFKRVALHIGHQETPLGGSAQSYQHPRTVINKTACTSTLVQFQAN